MRSLKKYMALGLSMCMLSSSFIVSTPLTSFAKTSSKKDDDKDYTIGSASWDDSERALATWDEPNDKTTYKVRLYRGERAIGNWITTSSTHYDFTKAIVEKGKGSYKFKVYSTKGKQSDTTAESDLLDVDADTLKTYKDKKPMPNNGTNGNNNGNNNNNAGANAPGNLKTDSAADPAKGPGIGLKKGGNTAPNNAGPGITQNNNNHSNNSNNNATGNVLNSAINVAAGHNGWNQIGADWWYKDDNGTAVQNGWKLVHNLWYYFQGDGVMKKGWYQNKFGQWFYLKPSNGDMARGWREIDGKWYFFDKDNGNMLVNTTTPDGYKVDASGVWVK